MSKAKEEIPPHCPKCGYTREDAMYNGDHHLCDGEIPESNSPVIPEGSEKRKSMAEKEADHLASIIQSAYHRLPPCNLKDHLAKWFDLPADKPAIDDTLKGESGWISTKDRIPDHHNLVNICMTSGAITVGRMARTNRWSIFTFTGTDIESQTNRVEYWQPLPASPAKP
jgi:hypothetical protein